MRPFGETYPERTSAVVIYGSYAKGTATVDYPQGLIEQLRPRARPLEHTVAQIAS